MKRYSFAIATICLILCACVTALAVLASLYGWSWSLEILSHFQAQYFMVAIALAIIALFFRESRFFLATVFLCAVLSAQLVPWYSLGPLTNNSPTEAANYKVISANLWVHNTNPERVLKFVREEQPDLAVFMEINSAMEQQLETLNDILPYSSSRLTPYRLGTAIYSKTPLSNVQLQMFDTRSASNMTASVEAGGQTISVVAIHPFPPVSSELFLDRNRAFSAVGDYIKSQSNPVILAGDFNTTMWSPYYRRLARITGLKNSRYGFGILPTWPSDLAYLRLPQLNALTKLAQIPIDHCLASPSLKVVGMHTGPNVGSDHLPIAIDFQIDSAT